MGLKRKIFMVAVSVFVLSGLVRIPELALSAPSGIIRVPQDYATITQAIDASNPGDTIIVSEGTYADDIRVNKPNLTLIADGEAVAKGFEIIADNVTLEGFTVANGGWGILLDNVQGCLIANNTLINNIDAGILLFASKGNTIIGNNVSLTFSWGIELNYSQNNTLINNTSTQNGAYGIYLGTRSYWNTLIGNVVSNNSFGINTNYCTTLIGNVAVNNTCGIYLGGSNCTLRNNIMNDNTFNFGISLGLVHELIHDIDSSNLVNGREIIYLLNQENIIVDPASFPNAGQVIIVNSTGITVRDLELSSNIDGVLLAYVTDSTVINMTIQKCNEGIRLLNTNDTIVTENTVTKCWQGIAVYTSRNVTLHKNIVKFNGFGLYLGSSGLFATYNVAVSNRNGGVIVAGSNHVIIGNIFANTTKNEILTGGIVLQGPIWNTTIVGNIVKGNPMGIFDWSHGKSSIYHNNFIDNDLQVYIVGETDARWDGGYPTGGNYWSDYNGTDLYSGSCQNESGSDGIGDTSHLVFGDEVDHYPLMNLNNPLPGDVNWDGRVDIRDIIASISIYGITEGDADWNVFADLAPRWGVIDIFDIVTCAYHYGETYP